MTLSREEIAVRFAVEYAVRNRFAPENAVRQGFQAADAFAEECARRSFATPAPVAPPAPTPAPEGPVRLFPPVIVKTDVPPMVGEVCRSPAPEAKRVRCECCGEMYCPAPCPPPVAGSAEDDVERAARALVENRGATYSVATNPPSKFVMIPSAYFEALRAALSRPVRP